MYSPVTCNGKINDGAYHTFKNYEDALASYNNGKGGQHIIECIIPKNSKYTYIGTCLLFTNQTVCVESYASQKLKPIKIIK